MKLDQNSSTKGGPQRKNHRRRTVSTAVLFGSILTLLFTGCGADPSGQYTYQPPVAIDDGLAVGSLDEVNVDSTLLVEAVNDIAGGEYGEIHSLLIFKDDQLVFEKYFTGHDYKWDGPDFQGTWVNWSLDKEHNIHSAGKSITSACIGIAIDQGFIESVDQSIFDYLPEHQHLNTPGRDKITIEHLLAMTSGLEWDEWGSSYADSSNDVIALWLDCDDPIACILQKPLVSEPGTDFTYSGGNIVVLGEIIRNATGMDIEAFSGRYLFEPLGIETPEWPWINDKVIFGGDQRLTPREMLKIGVTYLNDGVWDGRQIVSEEWVAKSATPYPGPDNSWFNNFARPIPPGEGTWGPRGYSYTWWTHQFSHSGEKYPAFWAFGWGGQRIIVLPDQDTVVVLTGGNYTSTDPTLKIVTKHVIPALD